MNATMKLLEKAEQIKDLSAWADTLGLTKRTLYTAKYRGGLSPAIAGALAEEMGEDPKEWIVLAALEGERDSACKTRMVKRLITGAALTLGAAGTAAAKVVCILCKVVGEPLKVQLTTNGHCE